MLIRALAILTLLVVARAARDAAVKRAYRNGYLTGCESTAKLWATCDELKDALTCMVEPGEHMGDMDVPRSHYQGQLRAAQEGWQ